MQAKTLDTEKRLSPLLLTLGITSVCDFLRRGNPGRSRDVIRDTSRRYHRGRNMFSRRCSTRGRSLNGNL
jgi:hypothetical protein